MEPVQNSSRKKKIYRQSVVLTEDMKKVLDEYCSAMDIPKSNFIRRAIFKEIERTSDYWRKRIIW